MSGRGVGRVIDPDALIGRFSPTGFGRQGSGASDPVEGGGGGGGGGSAPARRGGAADAPPRLTFGEMKRQQDAAADARVRAAEPRVLTAVVACGGGAVPAVHTPKLGAAGSKRWSAPSSSRPTEVSDSLAPYIIGPYPCTKVAVGGKLHSASSESTRTVKVRYPSPRGGSSGGSWLLGSPKEHRECSHSLALAPDLIPRPLSP
jgi:hypothetical protein